jgi:hypothetical protein
LPFSGTVEHSCPRQEGNGGPVLAIRSLVNVVVIVRQSLHNLVRVSHSIRVGQFDSTIQYDIKQEKLHQMEH